MSGVSAGVSVLNWRGGVTAICTMSDWRGAMSLAKPKSRFGGLDAARAGAASLGGRQPETSFANQRKLEIKGSQR
jgi:hypothetical protein